MVMEETPSPHCVGREFVRQYYTLLNQAPMHLHRFYNENSSFVHGGLDTPNRETKPVIGQRQIHHRIQQLEFNDCHAKIRQVDSQATLGNGVVVQVTGELSNNGEPMRRFTQTFVLAQQSPKKYYVHNDIFRYQDEMIAEEECEPDSGRSEAEEDMEESGQPEPTMAVTVSPQQIVTTNVSAYYGAQQPQQLQPPQQVVQPAAPTAAPGAGVNGSTIAEEVASLVPVAPQAPLQAVATQVSVSLAVSPTIGATSAPTVGDSEEGQDADDEAEDPKKVPELPLQQQTQQEPQEQAVSASLEPKTYATLVKSGGGSTFANVTGGSAPLRPPSPAVMQLEGQYSTVPPSATTSSSPPQQSQVAVRAGLQPRLSTHLSSSSGPTGGSRSGAGPRSSQVRASGDDRREIVPRGDSGSEDRRRMSGGPLGAGSSMYPDNQQVFVGNVPITASENDLRDIFSKFGPVADVRLNCKPSNKCPPGKIFPKYGFIVFSETAAVNLCLNARPISIPGDTPHNLNVEEKRNKFRSEGRMSMNDERGMGGGRSSLGRGSGSSGGMMRGRGGEGSMSRGGGRGGIRGGSEGGRGGMMSRGGGGGNSYNSRR